MNALDTNVLVRYLTRDNPEQAEAARAHPLYTFDRRLSRLQGTVLLEA